MDFGVIFQGESSKLNFWIKNQSNIPVEVSKITSSCDCLVVQLSKMHFGAGDRALVCLHYEARKEQDFVGSLDIEVELMGNNGTKVGQINVPIEIIRSESQPKN